MFNTGTCARSHAVGGDCGCLRMESLRNQCFLGHVTAFTRDENSFYFDHGVRSITGSGVYSNKSATKI